MPPRLSVCIVTGRRLAMLDACLATLQAQRDAPTFELLVCSDGDPDVAAGVRARFPEATIAVIERAHPGAARNVLIERARGELLVFLDDDVTVHPGLLRHMADLADAHPEAMVFGGPNVTPPASSHFQVVQGGVLSSIVGSGPVRRRYGPHPASEADESFFILCNLAVRRHAMVPFPNDLVCAEENAVLTEMRRRGLTMHYDPELVVFHERRATYRGFTQQMHKYGRGRGQLIRRQPDAARPAYLAPVALLAYLVSAPVVAVALSPLALVPAALYLVAVLAAAVRVSVTLRNPGALPLAIVLIVTLHVCYGSGVARGLLERPRAVGAPQARWIRAHQPLPTAATGPERG